VLFNSTVFLFGFLPITLVGFFVVARQFGANPAKAWLASSSLFFYGWWNPDLPATADRLDGRELRHRLLSAVGPCP
jgi:hypothetical protein